MNAKPTQPRILPLTLFVGLGLVSACSTKGGGITSGQGGTQGTGVGACECSDDAYCIAQADSHLDPLKAPRQSPSDRHYVGSACLAKEGNDGRISSFSRPALCACYYAFGSSEAVFENAMILGNRYDGCDVWSAGPGCVYRSCEFTGCDPASPTSCDALCAEVEARIAADNARTFDVQRRTSRCEASSCSCRQVYRVGDRCYASFVPSPKSYDCALSDDAILAAEYAPYAGNGMGHQISEVIPVCARDP